MIEFLRKNIIIRLRPEQVLLLGLLLASGCGSATDTPFLETEVEGHPVEIRMRSEAQRTVDAVLFDLKQEVQLLAPLFDPFSERSEISTINQTAGVSRVPISYDTYRLLEHLKRFSLLSDGAFDFTTSPLSELWGFEGGLAPSTPLTRGILQAALRGVGADRVHLSERSIRLTSEFTRIDIHDVMPSYALDLAILEERRQNVDHLMIRYGQSVRALGSPSPNTSWSVPLTHPETGLQLGNIVLDRLPAACMNPLSREEVMIAGTSYRNQIDPRTGQPVQHILLAVGLSKSATKAFALSEALLVLQREALMPTIERFQESAALVIPNREPLEIWISDGAESIFQILPEHQDAVQILHNPNA